MIESNGWREYCIWEHSQTVKDLYRKRSRREVEEMTAHAQAAELLESRLLPGDTLLDIGCGSGYFFHSLRERNLNAEYWGIDAAPSLIEIGKKELPAFGLAAERLNVMRIEDLGGKFDHVICINVLSNIDNFHKPLDRMLRIARKSVILRESLRNGASYSYMRDNFLDNGVDLKVYVNHYDQTELQKFIIGYGFTTQFIEDRRSGGMPEMVIGYPHYWKFVLAERI
jgi:ubiquinone/menaquinone biosynthesis C-methylase UbiE